MRLNRAKATLEEGRPVFAAWCTLADPAIVEMIGHAGYDVCLIDMEHTPINTITVQDMCRAADASGVTPIVRVPDDNPKAILRVLEVGAQGIIAPHVMSQEDARRLVQAVRYPPVGSRGISWASRAAQYGFANPDEHMRLSNSEIMLIALIEDKEAVEDIEGILATPGLDAALIAPGDLSASLGHGGEPNHPDIHRAADSIAEAGRRLGSPVIGCNSNHRMYTKSVPELLDLGIRFIVAAGDGPLLSQALRRNVESFTSYRG